MSKANSVFKKWRSKQSTKQTSSVETKSSAKKENFPLSSEQMRLWALAQAYPNNPVYNFILAYSFKGDVHVQRLEKAIRGVLQKQAILNTIIVSKGDKVEHRANPNPAFFDFVELDLRHGQDADQAAIEAAKAFGKQPFELDKELARARILNLGNGEYWLVFVAHHLVFDKQSSALFMEDVLSAYKNSVSEATPSETIHSFANYIELQGNNSLENPILEFWKNVFSIVPEPINWPFQVPEKDHGQFAGGYSKLTVPSGFIPALSKLAKQENTSLFTVLLSIYRSFLALYLDRADICIGIPVTNRHDERWQDAIGFFDNTLALRSEVNTAAEIKNCIVSEKNVVRDALEHGDMPFQELVKMVSPERTDSNPLFQTMFIYHDSPQIPTILPDITIQEKRIDLDVAKFDLTLYCQKNGDEFELIFETADRVFDEPNKRSIKQAFETYLQNLLENWNNPLSNISILKPEQKEQVLEWSRGKTRELEAHSVLELLTKQVKTNPNAVAISDGKLSLTYSEFDQKIEELVSSLQKVGVKENMVVGICLRRGISALTSMYAIHRIGASYLPIDPSYPKGRIDFMLHEANVSGVITVQGLADLLDFKTAVLVLDESNTIPVSLKGKIASGQPFEDGAYVLFTSGSTGKPKGVKITKQNLLHSTQNRFSFYNVVPERFLLLPSFSFDSSVAGLFWPLSNGGTLFVPPHDIEKDIEALARYIQQHKITTTLILPTLYGLLLEYANPEQLLTLKTVIVAGEASTMNLVDTHYRILPDCKLYNEYGPTEASVWCTACLLEQGTTKVPIGRPLDNTQIYLLNHAMQLVLPGHIGDLYVGGKGVSAGYLHSSTKDEDPFIPNPFGEGKLYRTGDLARFDKNGNLLFIGRKDQQIKINGKRIELEEVTAALVGLSEIKNAVVLFQEVQQASTQRKQLVAYLAGSNLKQGQIKASLEDQLPEHMVPKHYVVLSELPTLPNGKVDKGALEKIEIRINQHAGKPEKLSGSAKTLKAIWQEVLKLDNVSIHDNFFELGGDSILAIQIISKARNEGINLAPSILLEKQTIAEMLDSANLAVEQEPDLETSHFTPIQSWFFDAQGTNSHWNLGLVIKLKPGTESTLKQAIEHIIKRNSVLTSSFNIQYQAVKTNKSAKILFKSIGNGSKALDQYEIDSAFSELHRELDIETGHLVGALFINSSEPKLRLSIHHLVIDPVSLLLIFEELGQTVKLIQENRLETMPEPDAKHYFSINQAIQKLAVDGQLEFWQEQCRKEEKLPVNSSNTCYESDVIREDYKLDPMLSATIEQVEKNNDWLSHEVLFSTVIAQAVGDWANQKTVIAGLEQSLRKLNIPHIQHAIGWMTSYFPVKLNVTSENPITTAIATLERWSSIQNQGIGYGILRYQKKAPRLSIEPEVVINYLGKSPALSHKSIGQAKLIKEGLRSPGSVFHPVLEFNISFVKDRYNISYAYPIPKIEHNTVQRILNSIQKNISLLLANSGKDFEIAYKQKQLDDVGLDESDFDELLSQF